jgi:aspartyl-tRNA(Asn)/glutamyl-tRNA(Gln) amidotransferase subunit A
MKARTLIIRDFKKAFRRMDVLAAPTMPVVAPKLKDIESLTPIQAYMMDILTVGPSLAGIPHISVPCGLSKGLPVGLHLMADHCQEQSLLNAAHGFEKKV